VQRVWARTEIGRRAMRGPGGTDTSPALTGRGSDRGDCRTRVNADLDPQPIGLRIILGEERACRPASRAVPALAQAAAPDRIPGVWCTLRAVTHIPSITSGSDNLASRTHLSTAKFCWLWPTCRDGSVGRACRAVQAWRCVLAYDQGCAARRSDHSDALTLLNWPDALVRIAGPGPTCYIQADSGAKIRRRSNRTTR